MNKMKILVSIAIAITFLSCKKDSPQQPLRDLIKSGGSWIVSDFTKSGLDTSSIDFAGTSLTFETDGKVHVQGNAGSTSGTWETNNRDDMVFLLIDLEGVDFDYLESQWTLDSMSATQLKLIGGGFYFYDYMTLVKN
jgi:hypothetical protein